MQGDSFSNKAEAFEAFDDIPLSPPAEATIGAVIARRYGRRDVLKGSLAVTAATALFGTAALTASSGPAKAASAGFAFRELANGVDETHHVAEGYDADIVIRWGDPLAEDLARFDPAALTAADQMQRFGYNNDYLAFFPLDQVGTRGLLCVNHEYTSPEVMFAGLKGRPDQNDFADMTERHVGVEMAAHGVSVVELVLTGGKWQPVPGSPFNRRIMAETEMTVDGPAAGHDRLKTKADPAGRRILGTLNNCAGGQTPWGTYLTAEENFHGYFWTDRTDARKRRLTRGLGGAQQRSYDRYGVPANACCWGRFHDRFSVDKEPNEPNRFGWIVEIDPTDPASTPVKHTALGRFRHEGAEMIVNKDGRVVVYSGDDSPFEWWAPSFAAPASARRRDAVRRGSAPRHRRRQGLEAVRPRIDLRGPRHPLARFRARHAAAPLRGRHPQDGRRQDRDVARVPLPGCGRGIGTALRGAQTTFLTRQVRGPASRAMHSVMIRADVIVLGAGIVGVSAALHLQQRGRSVALIDRRGPGEETSFGNTGIIQREGVVPYAFPRDPVLILKYAFNMLPEANLHWSALPRIAPWLYQYWRHSTPERVAATARAMRPLVERCILEHEPFLEAAGVQGLARRTGYLRVYRSARTLDAALAKDEHDRVTYGVNFRPLDRAGVAALEPHLKDAVVGGILMPDPVSVADPGAVVKGYAALFERRGGSILRGEARTLQETEGGWQVQTAGDVASAPAVVIALGPWADDIFRRLGYRFPFGVKRGYHRHFRAEGNATLERPVFDAELGYLLTPMTAGIRLTTGAEFARRDAPPTPVQLARSLPAAREIFPLGETVDAMPWLGRRPCLPDMLPIVGPAPRHRGLWFDFGHHHLGLTLGPVTGRLLAEMMTGEAPFTDPAPYRADRF